MVKVQSRGLGKGLAALIAEIPSAPARLGETNLGDAGEVREIHLVKIKAGKFQPRTRFSELALQELSDSIMRNGVLQPIVVRQIQASVMESYEIIAGERRWRAAKQAGLMTIPAIVRAFNDQQAMEVALIENIQRADLSPLDEAAGYQRLMGEFNYTQEELAKIVGKSRSHVANLLRLLGLPEETRGLLEEGKLTMGHAKVLLGVQGKAAIPIAREVAERNLSVRQTEALVRSLQPDGTRAPTPTKAPSGLRRTPAYSGPKDPDITALEETLSENLGMKVEIRAAGGAEGAGEIAICYDSLSQLDEILRKLGGNL